MKSMFKSRFLLSCLMVLAIIVAAGACTSTAGPTTPTGPPAVTAGQVANSGATVFANRCAKCHGDKGQGLTASAIMGSNANLQKYTTAQGLLNFIDTAMPFDAPGSLSSQQYQEVLAYLLVQNNFVSPGTAWDPDKLSDIALKK